MTIIFFSNNNNNNFPKHIYISLSLISQMKRDHSLISSNNDAIRAKMLTMAQKNAASPVDLTATRGSIKKGAVAYGLLITEMRTDSKVIKYGKRKGNSFLVSTGTIIFGRIDPDPDRADDHVDESAGVLVSSVGEPDAVARAKQAHIENAESEVKERVEIRVPFGVPVRISCFGELDPSIRAPCVVCARGITFRGYYPKQTGPDGKRTLVPDVTIGSMSVPEAPRGCYGFTVRLIRENDLFSKWWEEEPFENASVFGRVSDGKISSGSLFTHILPVVPGESKDVGSRGVYVSPDGRKSATFLVKDDRDPRRVLQWPKGPNGEMRTDPIDASTLVVNPQTNIAPIDCARGCGRLFVDVTQYDEDKGIPMERMLKYQITCYVWGKGIHSFGLSHPRLLYPFSFHLPFMEGAVIVVENRANTCSNPTNVERASNPNNLWQTSQLVSTYCRSFVINVRKYLESHALSVKFSTAAMILGHDPALINNTQGPINHAGLVGQQSHYKTGVMERLDFAQKGSGDFICLNAVNSIDLRELDKRVRKYYILTSFSAASHDNLRSITSLMHNTDVDVLDEAAMEIAKLSQEDNHGAARVLEAGMQSPPPPWHSFVQSYVAYSSWGGVTPVLVFAVLGRDDGPFQANTQSRRDMEEIVLRAWKEGPNAARQDQRVNAPGDDFPPAEKRQKTEEPSGGGGSSQTPDSDSDSTSRDEPMAAATQEYDASGDDDDDDDFGDGGGDDDKMESL